jgi:hypothetical protein
MPVRTVVASKAKSAVLQRKKFEEARCDPRDDGASMGKIGEVKECSGEPHNRDIITGVK